jgi:RimJ/RimL family protein N-acetyltransferase
VSGPRLRTERLDLLAAGERELLAELESNAALAAALGAEVGEGWPPGVYDRGAAEFMLARTREGGAAATGWYAWYGATRDERPRLVLSIGYFGPPRDGEVEIGYSVVESERRRGFAREAIEALTVRALATPGVRLVCAHTTDDNVASWRALERAGFVHAGPGAEPGSRRYERFAAGPRA